MTATLAAPIEFTVPGVPVAQPRRTQRIITAGGRSFAHNYTPKEHPVHVFRAAVQQAFRAEYQGAPLDGPLRFTVVYVLPRPKSLMRKSSPRGRVWCTKKPDWDNAGKSTTDPLNGIAYRDDAQIAHADVRKFIASMDEAPHTEVRIEPLEGGS